MHNTESNIDPTANSTDWANRFVPLPPTSFPDDAYIIGSNADALPSLQEIAGVDPFFTPPVTNESPLNASSAALDSRNDRADGSEDGNDVEPVIAPSVEIIGQQLDQAIVAPKETPVAEFPQFEVKPGANQMSNSSSDNSSNAKQIAGIHEYDLAMKVLSNADSAGLGCEDACRQTDNSELANDAAEGYWGASNVSSFIPGVTPVEAYPVCQEFADQISMSGSVVSEETADASSENESSVISDRPEISNQVSLTDEKATGVSELEAVTDTGLEPIQIDPFDSDEFESVNRVPGMRPMNQNSGVVPELQSDSIDLGDAQATPEVPAVSADRISVSVATDSLEADENQLPVTAPLDLTKAIPQLPKSHITHQVSGSQQLFESVEQSLNELQSINEMDSEPVIEMPVDSAPQAGSSLEQTHDVELDDASEEQSVPQHPSALAAGDELDYQVVQVDGLDGYDFLDLKAFDVKDAMFCPGKIFLNTETAKFQVQYQNLKLAVFAGEFEVELK